VTLARPELEIVEPDQPRLGFEPRGSAQRVSEQMIRAGKARVRAVHGGGRDAGEAQRPWRALDFARERMWVVRLAHAPGAGGDIDEHAPAFDLHRIGRHPVFLEPRFALAGATMEFPVVPGTDDVIAVETSLAQRPAHVVARVRHRPEAPVAE